MTQEERLLAGLVFEPGDEVLRAQKLRCHELCARYNRLLESEGAARAALAADIFAALGAGSFLQGPIQVHYGIHTRIGQGFFANFNLVIQDDAPVTIGDHCNFGPGVTIVTPLHPMLPTERRQIVAPDGGPARVCWAKPVHIGSDCWFGANVTVCPGVTVGDGCVIGAGSVVTHDIPAGSFAAGSPCRVIRTLGAADSLAHHPELLVGGYRVAPEDASEDAPTDSASR